MEASLKRASTLFAVAAFLMASGAAYAAPSLSVTKPPASPVPSWTGPVVDPDAKEGQWFRDATGLEEVRPNEFYDNSTAAGGGAAGTSAIKGVVTSIVYVGGGPGTNILSFEVTASIRNDVPTTSQWLSGSNSH